MIKPDWDTYYLGIAKAVSARGDCVRAQHGAVLVKDHKIIATGYNGTPVGDLRSCGATGQCPRALDLSVQHYKGDYDLCWSTHAESNALLRASWNDMQGATIYITGEPCSGCSKLINSAGIVRVVTLPKEYLMGNYYDLFDPTDDECKEKGLMTRHEMGVLITRLTNQVNKLEEENASYKEFIERITLED